MRAKKEKKQERNHLVLFKTGNGNSYISRIDSHYSKATCRQEYK